MCAQVPAVSDALPASLHDLGLDFLRSAHCQGRGSGEGGASEGDREDDGIEELHLLAELGGQQHAAP